MSGLEASWKAGRILRLNVGFALRTPSESVGTDAVGVLARDLKVKRTPTFVLFDASGAEARRWVDNPPALEELP